MHKERVPDYLRASIEARLAELQRRRFWARTLLQVAAALVICISALAYHYGHLRFTPASQEAYIASVSDKVAPLMCVGLGQHIRCSVFRDYPRTLPTMEALQQSMGPEFQALVPIAKRYAPADYQLVMAHQCKYQDRNFVHVTLSNGTSLVSLLITKRIKDESFDPMDLISKPAPTGTPVYRAGAQRFQVSAFESPGYLVYVVSNMPEELNNAMLLSMTPVMEDFLKNLGS